MGFEEATPIQERQSSCLRSQDIIPKLRQEPVKRGIRHSEDITDETDRDQPTV
jgi:hypothetical protein